QRQKLLVLVGGPEKPIAGAAWQASWMDDKHDAAILPVLRSGVAYSSYFDRVINNDDEHPVRRANASWWQDKIAECLPALLARARVTAAVARLFISYRRLETLPMALQLFDEFTHQGFEVFLDRFSIEPGVDFQQRLTQELEDKSMVLFLESSTVKASKWTQHE